MAINKVIYGADTLVDLTEDTVTAEDVLNGKSFHTPDGVKRTGTASYPVTDVQVNGESVLDGTVAKIVESVPGEQTAVDSFTTETGGLLKSAVVQLDPIQDLHGYDNPWPAGGGKNKLEVTSSTATINGVTFTVNSDGTIVANGSVTEGQSNAIFNCSSNYSLKAGSYILSGCPANGSSSTYAMSIGGITSDFGNGGNFTLSSDSTVTIRCVVYSGYQVNNLLFKPMICLSSETDPDYNHFAPYSNICPIDGHTESQLLREGKNLFHPYRHVSTYVNYTKAGEVIVSGTISGSSVYQPGSSTARTSGYCQVLKAGTYKPSLEITPPTGIVINVVKSDGTELSTGAAFTLTEDTEVFTRVVVAPGTYDYKSGMMIEKGSAATDYEPYHGHLYTLPLGDKVYGGTVDFVTGEMTVTTISVVYDGSVDESWGQATGENRYYTGIPTGAKANDYDAISNLFKNSQTTAVNTPDMQFYVGTANVGARNNLITSVADWKTFLSNNNWHIVFNLITPTIIQLTPQQLTALVGQNNLSAPLTAQEVISATYEQIASFNAVLDDVNESSESTYSSEKIEQSYVGKDDVETKSATDSFVTTNGGLLSKCVVNFEPVQDLHGYDNPWPAGGGKNKLPSVLSNIKSINTTGTWTGNNYVLNGVTFAVQVDSANNVLGVKVTGTASAEAKFDIINVSTGILADTAYIMSGCPSGGSMETYRFFANFYYEGTNHVFNDFGSGVNAQWNNLPNNQSGSISVRVASGYSIPTGGLQFYPMLRLLSVPDPTFAPYSNKCPIYGHTEVDLNVVGKNWCSSSVEQGNLDVNGLNSNSNYRVRTAQYIVVKGGETFTVSWNSEKITQYSISEFNVADFTTYRIANSNWVSSGTSHQLNNATTYIRIAFRPVPDVSVTPSDISNLQIELGSTATTYEPYNPSSHLYQLSIGSTVYGGYVDLASGVITVDRKYVDLNSLTWTYRSDLQIFQTTDVGFDYSLDTSKANISSCYLYNGIKSSGSGAVSVNPSFSLYTNNRYMWVRDTRYTDPTAFTNSLLEQKAVLYLATPTTIKLTPKQIEALTGQNNLSCPLEGQSIETNGVEYKELFTFADVKKYADSKVFITEPISKASRTSEVIFYSDKIYADSYCELLQYGDGAKMTYSVMQFAGVVNFGFSTATDRPLTFRCRITNV